MKKLCILTGSHLDSRLLSKCFLRLFYGMKCCKKWFKTLIKKPLGTLNDVLYNWNEIGNMTLTLTGCHVKLLVNFSQAALLRLSMVIKVV